MASMFSKVTADQKGNIFMKIEHRMLRIATVALAPCLSALWAADAAAPELIIAADGRTEAVVVVSPEAGQPEKKTQQAPQLEQDSGDTNKTAGFQSGSRTGETPMTVSRTSKGTPIVHMWECPRPDPVKPGAGYPILEGATHTKVYHATPETGGYSHHARLAVHNGIFYAMWSNHPKGEDSPGQFVRFSISRDGKTWSEPRRLFPPYGEIKGFNQLGSYGHAAGWVAVEGKLWGGMQLTDHGLKGRENLGMVIRSVDASDADVALGPIFLLPGGKGLMATEPLAKEIAPPSEVTRATAEALRHAIASGAHPAGERTAVDTRGPCEPVYYRAKDGKHVCLLRDDEYSHRMYLSVLVDGRAWPAAQPTDIPDSPSLSDAVVLGDGTVLLIGNQMAPRFDNPKEVSHYGRDPLMVSVSSDGYRFTRAYALRTGQQKFRVPNVGGRGGGGQYPSSLVHNERLYVLYSMGKEDIWISSVALRDLGIGAGRK
jgi:hypothetical protein